MPYNDDLHHIVKTSAQWDERAIEFWVIPRGCLCVELTPEGKTKIKIGEGNKFYSQLPYVNDMSDLDNYYTKEEVDNIVTNINLMAIRSTDEYDTKNDLPTSGNKLGDVRFVKSSSPSVKTDPDVYLWNGSRWIYVGYELQDIDLSQYLKKDEFHELFDPIREKVEEMYPKMHTHENKNILDRIEEPYSTAEKEKLAGLENYDDTEIRELIAETGHTHPNKPVLDTITDDSLWSESDRTKFESLHNYDDTGVRNRLTDLESTAHTHSNKNILDQVTAAFTVEDKTKLDSLHNNEVFIGTDGMYGGREGLVPAPTIMDAGKFLCADGTWRPTSGEAYVEFIGATASEDGTNGLVPAPLAGEQSYYLRGDGTWAKVKQGGDKYKAGDGIYILSGETAADSFPFNIYSTTNSLEEYIIYGSTNGVGDWDSNLQKYVITITVSSEGKQTLNYTIPLDSQLFEGDYIVYSQGIFVHYKTNLINDNESLANSGIDENGGVYINQASSWFQTRLSAVYEVSDEKSYLVEYDKVYSNPGWYGYYQWNINLYNASMNITRTIKCRYTQAPFGLTPTSSEKYIRVSYPISGDAQRYHYHFYILGENAEPISGLPRINIYSNAVNTINVTTTNKPSEIYVKVAEDEGGGTTPGTEFTGIIYNEGVLDVTQEDPNALNELTVHFRESTKVLTIPDTYILPPATTSTLGGVIVGENLTIDENGVLDATGGSDYTAGEGIDIIGTTGPIDINYIRLDINNSRDNGSGGIIQFRNIRVLDNNGNSLQFSHASSIYGDGSAVEYGQNTRDESPQAMIEGRNKTCCTNFSLSKAPLKITFTLTSEISIANITSFSILTGADYTTRDPVSWDIYASNDGVTWYKIQEAHSPDVTTARSTWITDIPFVIPPDAVEVLPGVKTINAKIGTGLSFDNNDAITVDEMTGATALTDGASGTVPTPLIGDEGKYLRGDGTWAEVDAATNYVEGNAIEFAHPGMTDLGFNFDTFVSKFTPPNNGIVSVDSVNKSFTLTATGSDAYTNPWVSGDLYTIPVIGGRKYRFTWNSNAPTVGGNVYAFENANTSHMHGVNQTDQNYLEFTADTTSNVNFRFGVINSGDTITYSNIKFYEVDNADPDTNIINVKYGNGLSLDNNNSLSLNLSSITLQFIPDSQ